MLARRLPPAGKLADLDLGELVCLLAQCRGAVNAPVGAAQPFLARPHISAALELVEHRVERPRA